MKLTYWNFKSKGILLINASILQIVLPHNIAANSYLIFVHSINSGASVKKLTEGNLVSQLMRKGLLARYICTQCYFTYNASFYTQCGI